MKKFYIFGVLILILVAGLVYVQVVRPQLDNRMITAAVPITIVNEDTDFSFTYLSGEAGYTLIEPPVPTTTASGLQKVYILMNTQDYITFDQQQNESDTPVSVSIFVVKMPIMESVDGRQERLLAWAKSAPEFTSFNTKVTEPETVEMDGVKSLRYLTAGSYQQEVYLVSYQGNAYVFTGQYKVESDPIRDMFKDLVSSVSFY